MKKYRYISLICALCFLVVSFPMAASAKTVQTTLFDGSFTKYASTDEITAAGWTLSNFTFKAGTTFNSLYYNSYGGSTASAIYKGTSFTNSYVYSGKFNKMSTGGGQYAAVVFNYQDEQNYYFVKAEGAAESATIDLIKKIGNVNYKLATSVTGVSIGAFADNTFVVTNNNGTISCSIKGINIFTNVSDVTAENSVKLTGGYIGFKDVNTGGSFGEPLVKTIPEIVEERIPYFSDDFSNSTFTSANWTLGSGFVADGTGTLAQGAYIKSTASYKNEIYRNNKITFSMKVSDAQEAGHTSNYAYFDYNGLRVSIFSRPVTSTDSLIRLSTTSGTVIKEVPIAASLHTEWNKVEAFYDASGYCSIYVTSYGKKYALCEDYNTGVFAISTLAFSSVNTPTFIDNVKIYNTDFLVLADNIKNSSLSNIDSLNAYKGQNVTVTVNTAQNVSTSNTPYVLIATIVDSAGNLKAAGISSEQTAIAGERSKGQVTLAVPADIDDNCVVKAFVWSNLNSIEPLSNKIDVSMLTTAVTE